MFPHSAFGNYSFTPRAETCRRAGGGEIILDLSQYTKPATIRYMVIGAGIGFFLTGLIDTLASILLGIIVVLIGVFGEALMGGRQRPTTGIPRV